eukprot:CAMPEP_0170455982 /NCGR_PEP_ID=MMETSP0123-20130129/3767_1 /TAXON_ID=182087 /ORGANISM="Favella ehrenbergii, Strain Fehren 1" /LENGTH=67 /DNA_ID=CAMNT_0010719305 /DNA_START=562 /DNA_END=765 /DNA_ORIENTATION=+
MSHIFNLVEVVQSGDEASEILPYFFLLKIGHPLLDGLLEAVLQATQAHICRDQKDVLVRHVVDNFNR